MFGCFFFGVFFSGMVVWTIRVMAPFGSARGADSGALQGRSLGLRTGADSRALAEKKKRFRPGFALKGTAQQSVIRCEEPVYCMITMHDDVDDV